jgi:hypothetical protein
MHPHILQEIQSSDWHTVFSQAIQTDSIAALEDGKIIYFPYLPFLLQPEEHKFLSAHYVDPKTKNISFNSLTNAVRGAQCAEEEYLELKNMLQRFSRYAEKLIQQLLPSYTTALKMGRTSFRPVEISGRVSSYRKDDTRLHVDAFPATPNQGQRILRVFSNINPDNKDRIWRIGEPFIDVAKRYLPTVPKFWRAKSSLLKILNMTKSYRSEYDHIMLQIHDRMKADLHYQKTVPQVEMHFAPGNSWIVQTDHVSHAAMSGQHVLEQTFYLPVSAMMDPDKSPLHTLEKLSGRQLV